MILMPPLRFLQRPSRWLRAISRYRATVSTAPDFAYRLCVERTADEERAGLDLSSWEIAYCGAEPIRRHTLDLFTAAFGPCGFRRDAFLPCYGLAEATLMVSSRRCQAPLNTLSVRSLSVDAERIEICAADAPDVRTLTSCGPPVAPTMVKVVEVGRGRMRAEDEIGELCIRGPSVTSGYWGREPDPADLDDEGYRRTGDLGFLHDGEIYITGRLKSVILIRGRNLQAEDIELTAGECHPLTTPAGCAAIGIDEGTEEELHLLVETVSRKAEPIYRDILDAVRAAIVKAHGVVPARILLIRRGILPRTTSGKLRRSACRTLLRQGDLPTLARWDARAKAGT